MLAYFGIFLWVLLYSSQVKYLVLWRKSDMINPNQGDYPYDITKELNDIKSRLEGLEMRILSMGTSGTDINRQQWEDAQRRAFTLLEKGAK